MKFEADDLVSHQNVPIERGGPVGRVVCYEGCGKVVVDWDGDYDYETNDEADLTKCGRVPRQETGSITSAFTQRDAHEIEA
jgi:hypothetical protein